MKRAKKIGIFVTDYINAMAPAMVGLSIVFYISWRSFWI